MCNPRVCIIGVYFGTFPDYFDLWLRSAAANHTVDFMIFTDAKARELPDNVRFLPISFDEIIKRGQGKMDLQTGRISAAILGRHMDCCSVIIWKGMIIGGIVTST